MTRRTPLLRFLALFWATVQLASPLAGSLAEARLAARAAEPVAHVEASSSARCAVVHSPECAVCRYLSTSAPPPAEVPHVGDVTRCGAPTVAYRLGQRHSSSVLPDGRAPPLS